MDERWARYWQNELRSNLRLSRDSGGAEVRQTRERRVYAPLSSTPLGVRVRVARDLGRARGRTARRAWRLSQRCSRAQDLLSAAVQFVENSYRSISPGSVGLLPHLGIGRIDFLQSQKEHSGDHWI